MATRKTKKTIAKDEGILLSEEQVKQVWDFYEFASSYNTGAITPMLLNDRMKDLTLNPLAPTQATLDDALLHPKQSEDALMGISEHFEIVSQPYKRLLSYLSSMLAFDLTYTPKNAEKDDFGTKAFKRDEKAIEDYFDKFDYKARFAIVVKELLRNETFFGCPRYDGEKYIIQELPSSPQYTKITGRFSHGLLGSFNMYFFLLPGVDLRMYPDFFTKKAKGIWGDKVTTQSYNPALSPEEVKSPRVEFKSPSLLTVPVEDKPRLPRVASNCPVIDTVPLAVDVSAPKLESKTPNTRFVPFADRLKEPKLESASPSTSTVEVPERVKLPNEESKSPSSETVPVALEVKEPSVEFNVPVIETVPSAVEVNAPYSYYGIYIKSNVDNNSGTASIRSAAKG